ncbi:MAG: rRNA pseudouridine synthase [Clostridiales bacterium]|nr:rRNA pseudouridine synthase [Clostridiales bacterium]MCF8021249.1 rRNA pseudouridine synthase [Clostridiales bacterium]
MEERLQKYMARAGVASRRYSERMISCGRVKVNGTVEKTMGTKIDPASDTVTVDGKVINIEEKNIYLILNKPGGYVTTMHDPQGRPIVTDLLKGVQERVYPVGRLDYNTKGLLLLTNDGELTYALTHPSYKIFKTYRALVSGVPSKTKIKDLQKGIKLEDGLTAPAKVRLLNKQSDKSLLEITIYEGRNRQVRRMCEYIGCPVLDLERVRLGDLNIGELKIGEYRYLAYKEVHHLKSKLGLL